jgi:DNA-directed RNA polymerase specialized sigma24 family protein
MPIVMGRAGQVALPRSWSATHSASHRDDGRVRELELERLPDHLDRMFRAALALCGTRHDAEDLVQETYARVLRRPRFLRNEDDGAYLMRALRNTWINMRKSGHARRSVPLEPEKLEFVADPGADPQSTALDVREAFAAVAELSPPLRRSSRSTSWGSPTRRRRAPCACARARS